MEKIKFVIKLKNTDKYLLPTDYNNRWVDLEKAQYFDYDEKIKAAGQLVDHVWIMDDDTELKKVINQAMISSKWGHLHNEFDTAISIITEKQWTDWRQKHLLKKQLTPPRYFYIGSIRLTHPDWINYIERKQFKK